MTQFLVVGGSRGIGRTLCNYLVSTKAGEVYTVQRSPIFDEQDASTEIKPYTAVTRNYVCDMREPADVLKATQRMLSDRLKFDAIMVATGWREDRPVARVTVRDVEESYMVNTLNPLFLLWYLDRFDLLQVGCRIGWLLDDRITKIEQMSYSLSKSAIKPALQVMANFWMTQPRVCAIYPPQITNGTEDRVTDSLSAFMCGTLRHGGSVLDLR